MAWIETTEAGSVAQEQGLTTLEVTAAEDLKKGNLITLVDMNIADVGAAELGPYAVCLEDIDNGEKGVVAIAPSIVYALPGAAGWTAFTQLMPSEQTDEEGRLVDVSTPVFDEVAAIALEGASDGATAKKVRLGYF